MSPYLYALLGVGAVSIASLIGAATLAFSESKLLKALPFLVSFSVGAFLGEVFLHLLPEMAEDGFGVSHGIFILAGIFLFLILEKIIRWHHAHQDHEESAHAAAWLTLVGDGVHNFLDGVLIAVSFLVSIPLGMATTLAVLFHEIPHELGDFMVLLHGGFKAAKALLFNLLSALTSFIGVACVWLFTDWFSGDLNFLLSIGVASFLYIAMADLIPGLNRERAPKRVVMQLVFLIAGITVMAGLLFLE